MSHVLFDSFPGVFNRNQAAGGITGFDADIFTGLTVTGVDAVIGNTTTLPFPGSLMLFLNGILLVEGSDYSLAGTAITWLAGSGTALNLEPNDCVIARYAF